MPNLTEFRASPLIIWYSGQYSNGSVFAALLNSYHYLLTGNKLPAVIEKLR
jgi:hypothetical protein